MLRPTRSRGGTYFGLLLGLPALGIAGWAGNTAVRWTLAYRWPAVPCVIQASAVREVSGHEPYRFVVRYRYGWRGNEYTGATYREDYRGSWDIASAGRLARRYPVDVL